MKYAVMLLSVYKAICDKIRELLGLTDTIKADEISDKVDEVYERGKDAEWNKFWDAYQQNGTRFSYYYAFSGTGWNDETFYPKYDIVLKGSNIYAFAYCQVTDLVDKLKKCGVTLDTQSSSTNNYMFYSAQTKRLPPINLTGHWSVNGVFADCSNLESIEKIIVVEQNTFSGVFTNCPNLKNITFKGIIGQNGLDLHWSTKLTHDSIMNVINCLKNFNEVILENCPVTAWNAFELPTTHTLVEGEKYSLTYEGDNFEMQTAEATVTQIYDMNAGVNVLGLEFNMPSYEAGSIPRIWIYNDNGKLMYDAYYDPTTNGKIKLTKISTETHTVTLGATNLAKLTDAEKAIATQKGWTLA